MKIFVILFVSCAAFLNLSANIDVNELDLTPVEASKATVIQKSELIVSEDILVDTARLNKQTLSTELNDIVNESVEIPAKYKPKKLQKVEVKFMDSTVMKNAVLLSYNEREMLFAKEPTKQQLISGTYLAVRYSISDIQNISARLSRRGANIGGIVGGVITGLFLGAVGAMAGADPVELVGYSLLGAGMGAGMGAGIGALLGQAAKTNIIINGNTIHYKRNLKKLEKYSIEKYKITD